MQTFWQDVRFGWRMLRKAPGFAVLAVLATALGIGATTTIFSSTDATLLRPFVFPQQERLVVLFERKPSIGFVRAAISPGNLVAWRAQAKSLQDVIVLRNRDYTLTGQGPAERYTAYGVSAGFFDALGVKPLLGRTFERGEDEVGRAQVAVLKHRFWQTRFGGDPQVLGKQVLLDDKPFTIIGVMPKDFEFPFGAGEMWTPFVIEPAMAQDHSGHYLRALAVLKPGVTLAQANAELSQIAQRIAAQFPDGEAGHEAYAVALNEEYTRGAKTFLPVMIGSALLVLLIACSNVANLLLVRATARQREMAVRLALGAPRWRLLRQLLTESVMLALAGGALGILLAYWGIDALAHALPYDMAKFVPGWSHLSINYRVLAFTTLISVLTGILFGLLPAWQATNPNLNETLKDGGAKGTAGQGGRASVRSVLVVAEIALSLMLLIGAGLLVRSFIHMLNADLGVKPANVLTLKVRLPREQAKEPEQRRQFFEQLLERLAALPGVTQSGAVHALPLGNGNDGNSFQILGQPSFEQGKEPHTEFRIATPGYFAAIGTDLRRGRLFTQQDNDQVSRVVLVNEAFAGRFLPGKEILGQRLTLGDEKDKPLEIIGVVANVMNADLDDLAEPCLYLPFAQVPVAGLSLVLRSTGAPEQLVPAVRQQVAQLDARIPLAEVKTMSEVIHERLSPKELMMWLLLIFGLMSLLMAAVGTYAVMSYSVAQRTHELGVRLALGAQTANILCLVLQRGLALAAAGIVLGLVGAWALTRTLGQFLYGVSATDPLTFGCVATLLALVALLACYVPARRATNVDPLVALRHE